MRWKKSSHSSANGSCVEIADPGDGAVFIRNSKVPERGRLTFPAASMADFVAACAAGELDDLAR